MRNYLFYLVFIFGCNERASDKSKEKGPPSKDIRSANLSGCYLFVLNRDTIIAKLYQEGSTITGKLVFDNYQKDGSRGEVSGVFQADILKLIYSFQSEGMNSIMEVNFKYDGNSLTRGVGEMGNKGDTVIYLNPGKISYSGSRLNQIPCEKIPGIP